MKVLKKRTVTFRPEPSVKAMLAELEALTSALELNVTIEDMINAALRSYLPAVLANLKASSPDEQLRQKALSRAEAIIRGEKIV